MNNLSKLSELIDKAEIQEEKAIPIFNEHISNALFWSGLNDQKKTTIIKGLNILTADSVKHVQILEKIKLLINPTKYVRH